MESIVKDQYILILNVKKKHYGLFSTNYISWESISFQTRLMDYVRSLRVQLRESRIMWSIVVRSKKRTRSRTCKRIKWKYTILSFLIKNKTVPCFCITKLFLYYRYLLSVILKEGNLFTDDELQEFWNTNFIVNRDKEKLNFLLSVIKNTNAVCIFPIKNITLSHAIHKQYIQNRKETHIFPHEKNKCR